MAYKNTPHFWFSRAGKTLWVSFNNHPLKDAEGKDQNIDFSMTCESPLEAHLLREYLSNMEWEMQKHFFTEGYNTHKKREKNYML